MPIQNLDRRRVLCAGLAGLALLPGSSSFAADAASGPPAKASAAEAAARWNRRHSLYYRRNWGVDVIGVRPMSSGYMLEFRYRIVDPKRAAVLNDRDNKAYLIDEATGTALAVPAMENIGELRASTTPQMNRVYFMIFGNPGRLVKSGSKVTIVSGPFRIEGLIVD